MARRGHFADCTSASFAGCSCEPRRYWHILVISLAIGVLEFAGGLLSGSLALWADTAHVGLDAASAGISIYAARAAHRHEDEQALRIRYMRISAGLLLAALGFIAYEALERLREPTHVAGTLMLTVAVVGLSGNLWQHWLVGRAAENVTAKAQRLHVESDLYASGAVIVGAAGIALLGWTILDPLTSLGIVLFLGWRTIRLIAVARHEHHHH